MKLVVNYHCYHCGDQSQMTLESGAGDTFLLNIPLGGQFALCRRCQIIHIDGYRKSVGMPAIDRDAMDRDAIAGLRLVRDLEVLRPFGFSFWNQSLHCPGCDAEVIHAADCRTGERGRIDFVKNPPRWIKPAGAE